MMETAKMAKMAENKNKIRNSRSSVYENALKIFNVSIGFPGADFFYYIILRIETSQVL